MDIYLALQVGSAVLSFVLLFTGWAVWLRKEFGHRTITIKNVGTFRIKRKWDSLQSVTPIVSSLFYKGGNVPNDVRQELCIQMGQVGELIPDKDKHDKLPNLFINLSNHPFDPITDKDQIDTAEKMFGVDNKTMEYMAFPNIDPTWSKDVVNGWALDYAKRIISKKKTHNVIVHVMGEMNFTCRIVKLLMNEKIRCVASTTERDPTITPPVFKFVTFRDYTL